MLKTLIAATDPENYQAYLNEKISNMLDLLKKYNLVLPKFKIFASPAEHYRMRAEFAIFKKEDGQFNFAMFEPGSKPRKRIDIESFPVGSKAINRGMDFLKKFLPQISILYYKLFEIDFLSNQADSLIVSLNYHCKLDDKEWMTAALHLKAVAKEQNLDINFVGRSKKQLLLAETDSLLETVNAKDGKFYLYQTEGHFSQPNIFACQEMINFARDCCRNCKKQDLIELYCGSGTFTVCLADLFNKVFATEVSRIPTQTVLKNLIKNNITNTKIARLSAVEVSEALNGVREFKRLKLANIDIREYKFGTLLIDPPRSGLQYKEALDFTASFNRIIYISCGPETLAQDLSYLCKTHYIEKLVFFDQFPYTKHLESGVLLIKKT